jgi:hypothetical protein
MNSMSRSRAIIIVLIAVLFVPFPTVVVPTWKIRIIDTSGHPCADQLVDTSWGHYTINVLGSAFNSESKQTGADGYVEFPTRTIWSPLIWRLIAPLIASMVYLMHGGSGIYATIDTDDKADTTRAWISWRPGEPRPSEIVVNACHPKQDR